MGDTGGGLVGVERMIYLDHNSTTPYSPSVQKYIKEGILEDWHNPSSVNPESLKLNQEIKEIRQYIANYLNCSPKHLYFTSGGTESINTIISKENLKLNSLNTIITSHLEHHATIKKIEFKNTKIHFVKNNTQGEINLEHLEEICSKYPNSLLSFLSANNETGVITDIESVSKIAKKYNCLIHIDAVQSLGKEHIDLQKWNIDFASFSGHKIGSLKGVGLLYAKKPFTPLMLGGDQEKGFRAGTYNYPAINSMKLAIQDIDLEKQTYVKQLRDYLESSLHPDYFKVNCKNTNRLANTSNIYCKGKSNQALLLGLMKKSIFASVGSACNSGSMEPSHVITALENTDYARSCIRISISTSNTKREIDLLINFLTQSTIPNFKTKILGNQTRSEINEL